MELDAEHIGGGFTVYHGYSTIVFARSIGKNFTVYQQVTIGAGAVVVQDVPDNATVVGAPVRVLVKQGDNNA